MSESIISQMIYEHRRRLKLSQKELGDMVGVSNRAVSKWEKSLANPSTEICLKLAEIFKISLDTLMSGGAEPERRWLNKSGMESLRELYRMGRGPSSSHSMAPERAALLFRESNPSADALKWFYMAHLLRWVKVTDAIMF